MRAAVCHTYGAPLSVEEVTIDPPQTGEVLVRLAATAICHSDIHLIRGEWGGDVPVIAGHEGAGVVSEVGPGVADLHPGDHVVVSLLRSCGRCRHCTSGLTHLCEGDFALRRESRLRTAAGQQISHGLSTAAFAEYTVVDQSQLAVIPKALPLEVAALLACGVITGVGAVINRARVSPGSSVAVIGAGGVGLNAIQGARLSGANPIIALDLVESKLAVARTFGATHTIHVRNEDPGATISAMTGQRMADYVFVTVGSAAAAELAYDLAGVRGTVVFVGIPDWSSRAAIPIGATITAEKTVTGSLMGTTRLRSDVARLIGLYDGGRLLLDDLISARYPLAQINEAIASTESGAALRNVIVF